MNRITRAPKLAFLIRGEMPQVWKAGMEPLRHAGNEEVRADLPIQGISPPGPQEEDAEEMHGTPSKLRLGASF